MSSEVNVMSIVDEICGQPSLTSDMLLRLRTVARNNLVERKSLQTRLGALDGEPISPEEKTLRIAAFNWILSRYDQAAQALGSLSGPNAHLIRGQIALDQHNVDNALSELKAAAEQSGSSKVEIEIAGALRIKGDLDGAMEVLQRLEGQGTQESALFCQRGRCLEALGKQEDACNAYQRALEIDPQDSEAAFRLAYFLDLRGEDEKAIELYKKVTGQGPAFVSAMVNLALLHEDKDDLDNAINCLKEALRVDPQNKRATLYLRDCIESLDMYYDENERKENERLEAVLRIPISDFELSVRSRNCLAKMNVKSLGDIVRKTEQELLAYKNFGETSLNEIKHLLESKGLRLGMFKDEENKRARAQRMRVGGPENSIASKPITDLELSVRARKCMQRLNIESMGDLLEKSEADLLSTKNFGQTSLIEIKAKLGEMGLSLKPLE